MNIDTSAIDELAAELDETFLDDLVTSCFEGRGSGVSNGGEQAQRAFLAGQGVDASGMDEDALTDAVDDAHGTMASEVNNLGKQGQVEFLLKDGFTPEHLRELSSYACAEIEP